MLGSGTVAGGGDLNTLLSLFAVLLGLRLALLCWLSPTSIETGLSAKLHSGSSSVIPREWSRFEICIEIVCFLVSPPIMTSIIRLKHH